jgi:hypothetical protein
MLASSSLLGLPDVVHMECDRRRIRMTLKLGTRAASAVSSSSPSVARQAVTARRLEWLLLFLCQDDRGLADVAKRAPPVAREEVDAHRSRQREQRKAERCHRG